MSKFQNDAKTHLKAALRVASKAEVADFGTDPLFWANVVRDVQRAIDNFSTSRDRTARRSTAKKRTSPGRDRPLPGWQDWKRFEERYRRTFLRWAEPAPRGSSDSRYAIMRSDDSPGAYVVWARVSPSPDESFTRSSGGFYDVPGEGKQAIPWAIEAAMAHRAKMQGHLRPPSARRDHARSTPTKSGRLDPAVRRDSASLQVGDRVVSRHDDEDVGTVVEVVGRRPGEAVRVRWSVARATYLEDPDDLRRAPAARSRGRRSAG